MSRSTSFVGYAWLLIVCGLLLVRLLFDPTMVRRPLLEPNLSTGGLLFIGGSLFMFLMANVVTSDNISASDLKGVQGARALLERTRPLAAAGAGQGLCAVRAPVRRPALDPQHGDHSLCRKWSAPSRK